jgi:hypothetical protein
LGHDEQLDSPIATITTTTIVRIMFTDPLRKIAAQNQLSHASKELEMVVLSKIFPDSVTHDLTSRACRIVGIIDVEAARDEEWTVLHSVACRPRETHAMFDAHLPRVRLTVRTSDGEGGRATLVGDR